MQNLWLLLLIPLLYLFVTSPHRGRVRSRLELRALFAHRGLHDIEKGVPENSLAAFRAAVAHGYGIELDVHLTADDQLIVFHDDDFARACADPRDPREMTLSEIRALRLFGTDEPVPTLDEALRLVNGRAPLLVELKNCKRHATLARLAAARMEDYAGEYLFESFSPLILTSLTRHSFAPKGQLVSAMDWSKGATPRWLMLLLSWLPFNFMTRPDFVAYDQKMDNSLPIFLQRHVFDTPLCVWTVRTPEDYERLSRCVSLLIFEGFLPSAAPEPPKGA